MGIRPNLYGITMGFIGGMFIAFISFSMLPFAIENGYSGVYGVSFGMLLGIGCAVLIEGKGLPQRFFPKTKKGNAYFNAGILLSIGIMTHHFAEGAALSGVMLMSKEIGATMLILIGLHILPETTAAVISLRRGGVSLPALILSVFLLIMPLGAGYVFGQLVTFIPSMPSYFMSISAGIMLYTSCGEMLPETNGGILRAPSVFACLGFIFGLLFVV